MSDEIDSERKKPFDRETFISSEEAHENAFKKGTWFVMNKNGEGVVQEPIPESVKATKIIPEGFALDE